MLSEWERTFLFFNGVPKPFSQCTWKDYRAVQYDYDQFKHKYGRGRYSSAMFRWSSAQKKIFKKALKKCLKERNVPDPDKMKKVDEKQ